MRDALVLATCLEMFCGRGGELVEGGGGVSCRVERDERDEAG